MDFGQFNLMSYRDAGTRAADVYDLAVAQEHLEACLELNPTHGECQHFLNFIKRKQSDGGKA